MQPFNILKQIFKKLTIFDIILTSVFLLFILGFFFFFSRKAEFIDLRVTVTDQDVLYANTFPRNWYADRFEVGDAELDTLGRKNVEITSVEKFNITPNRKVIYLDLKARATYDTRTKLYYIKGKSLVFGRSIQFNLGKVTFHGLVTEFPGSETKQQVKIGKAFLTTIGRMLEPSLASSVRVGDKIYNSKGALLAEVLDVTVRPAEQVTTTEAGNLLLRYNPLLKDLILKVAIPTKTVNNETFMFDNLVIKVGEIVPLNFEKASLFPTITEFSIN